MAGFRARGVLRVPLDAVGLEYLLKHVLEVEADLVQDVRDLLQLENVERFVNVVEKRDF